MILLAAAGLLACPAAAQVRPQPGAGDPRSQTVEYRAEQVVQLQGVPGYQLGVEFAPDERIESVAVGDCAAWQGTPNRRGDRLFVKAVQSGVSTNMTVVTDARIYLFDLTPLYGASADMAYAVRFTYPQPAAPAAELPGAAIEARYALSGDRALRPSAMSDDGARTYIEWPADATLPAVYALDARGRATLVNGMIRDGVFVIDAVAERLVFRIDSRTARAVRKPPKASQ